MRIVFGVMSNKWEIIADDLLTAKIAMALHIGKKVPIAIYEPMEDGFIPSKDFIMNYINYNRTGVMEAQRSIKIVRKKKSDALHAISVPEVKRNNGGKNGKD